ncbi:LuxR C-terminal-related transcriptional regulator [Streptomyces sp. Z26]|uniref:helix-turn-helix transcriptional regulator n=1 Tax=Streptomyces TaxID=1883 RepID=UPI000EF167A2|nr:LuxR C-terminal-related transcriptional regulator [Streptomyces sp. Z26]RLL68622.1 PAS domain-containing protein [Streptomyces sp. Z26]
MASLDSSLTVVAADAAFLRQFGATSAEIFGRNLYELLHPSAPQMLDRHFARLADGRRTHFAERVVGLREGDKVFSAEMTGVAVQSVGNSLSCVMILRPDDGPVDVPETAAAARRNKAVFSHLDARILEGVASGSSTVQLAARLYLSRQGVEYHVGLMLRRMKVPNRAALVARAHSMGMLTVGSWPPRVLPDFVKDAK